VKSNFISFLDDVRTSYWFIPGIMVLAAMLLSFGAVQLDAYVSESAPDWLNWLFDNQPEGAREVLATIAGSMITVAGVVFSITLVAVSNAAYRLSPRLLSNFMRDRANQITLGTFISTFIYCLLVLRAVEAAPRGESSGDASMFVPHVAILLAIVLSVLSIANLIFFIHHIPRSIQVSTLVARIGKDLSEQIVQRFPEPEEARKALGATALKLKSGDKDTRKVCARNSGYVRIIEAQEMVSLAAEHDLEIALEVMPGAFVIEGEPLLIYRSTTTPSDDDRSKIETALCEACSIGEWRTPMQDPLFLLEELSEIAMRGLSPGINDPVTAISALNWMVTALSKLDGRADMTGIHTDEQDTPRVREKVPDFDTLVRNSLDVIAPDFARSLPASRAYLDLTARLQTRFDGDRAATIKALRKRFNALVDGKQPQVSDTSSKSDGPSSKGPGSGPSSVRRILSAFSF
tara:strand:- start:10636 stop:12018 length:1383 start_codon:yes stop_codon:yes gene_type:complete